MQILHPFGADCSFDIQSDHLLTYRTGQIINDCINGIPSVGFVQTGRVDAYTVALDGRDIHLSSLSVGQCFGISNLLSGQDLDTVLRCGEVTTVAYLQKSKFIQQMEANPNLALQYATLCNEKLQFLIGRIELLTMQTSRGKVIAYLLSRQTDSHTVILQGSKDNWASSLGISRATLFRELTALHKKNLISTKGATITVLDQDGLENLLYHPSSQDK